MRRISKIHEEDEIDLVETLKVLWNEKILILSIALFFMIVGYVYASFFNNKIYKSTVIINDVPKYLFKKYEYSLPSLTQEDLSKIYNNEFKLNLISVDNLVEFTEQNNEIAEFKFYLKDKNINYKKYFEGKVDILIEKNENISDKKYSLKYHETLPGDKFFNDYIIFTKEKTEKSIKKQITELLHNILFFLEKNLTIAENIGLQDPVLKKFETEIYLSNENAPLLYAQGSKILSLKIDHLKKEIFETQKLTLTYNPLLEKASSPKLVSKNPLFFLVTSLFLGLFISLIVILFKRHILKIKNS
jgi:LPS O-antigen subunit length determinant protein (WzzB/FepE family)